MKRIFLNEEYTYNEIGIKLGYMIISFLISILVMQILCLCKVTTLLDIKINDILYIGESIVITGCIITISGGRSFLKKNLFRRKEIFIGIFTGAISGLIVMFITYLYRLIPICFGESIIEIGSNQVVSTYKNFSFEGLIVTAITPAILEETIFRVVGFSIFACIFKFWFSIVRKNEIKSNSINVLNLKSGYGLSTLFITSLVFALMHGPSILSLPIYLLPGLLFGFLYCKYGLGVSISAHCISNYLSSLVLTIVVFLINLLF
ncbi:CPBP family glutamic-type intramembrane protease [Clostridium chauvoei]|uniref:CPBP family intramembrane metalloprotease n=2 Tax=Clostridium chauvoei TaxID=46867 RepID=A0ABD4RF43_9CLOT|nr:CPBP family glutamic-type intramembrane protease [Clostridium chauvoei]ATD55108.1 hypothetical protein BTM20_07590 [Clostridium chauvoei]ATD57218.1 hypothetical protein BTM21_05465 [Clostridium chauvoei]MBX7279453.1 CPBP family intramembrane metalloprotease [Clostridium chauvoei]MBX7282461.1 CPBP family intramembrane metalloprotease [Clostridium chauvoei]MBX7285652.1 CPBP family intramembrane metalloprotease [Clostridium chauvoei]